MFNCVGERALDDAECELALPLLCDMDDAVVKIMFDMASKSLRNWVILSVILVALCVSPLSEELRFCPLKRFPSAFGFLLNTIALPKAAKRQQQKEINRKNIPIAVHSIATSVSAA